MNLMRSDNIRPLSEDPSKSMRKEPNTSVNIFDAIKSVNELTTSITPDEFIACELQKMVYLQSSDTQTSFGMQVGTLKLVFIALLGLFVSSFAAFGFYFFLRILFYLSGLLTPILTIMLAVCDGFCSMIDIPLFEYFLIKGLEN